MEPSTERLDAALTAPADRAAVERERSPGLRNQLLRAIPPDELVRVAPHLQPVQLEPLNVIAEGGEPLADVWFPENGIISAVRRMRDGSAIEVGAIGREGMAGVGVLLGEAWTPSTLMGQVPGVALRMPADVLRDALPELPALARLLRLYALSYVDQLGQTIACNGLHSVEKRCARWLLMAHDRVGDDDLLLTHDVLALMLAVRRAGVSVAAAHLQGAGLIRYSRGRVRVLDHAGLEAAACECYATGRASFERVLGQLI